VATAVRAALTMTADDMNLLPLSAIQLWGQL